MGKTRKDSKIVMKRLNSGEPPASPSTMSTRRTKPRAAKNIIGVFIFLIGAWVLEYDQLQPGRIAVTIASVDFIEKFDRVPPSFDSLGATNDYSSLNVENLRSSLKKYQCSEVKSGRITVSQIYCRYWILWYSFKDTVEVRVPAAAEK